MEKILQELLTRYPVLKETESSILQAFQTMEETYINGGKVLCCGNGGSCADGDHIVGELMKCFRINRPLSADLQEKLQAQGEDGALLATHLARTLPAISLNQHPALASAMLNDVDAQFIFAQQVIGYGKSGDVLIAISTSGNSKNCMYAARTAKALGVKVIALTGAKGGALATVADVAICVPETETFKVQELHLPVYHCLCAMLEARFFA